jgi:hypothetical protein
MKCGLALAERDFGRMTHRLSEHLGETTNKSAVISTEGGYQPSDTGGGGLQDVKLYVVPTMVDIMP